jgi:hypothetical protein
MSDEPREHGGRDHEVTLERYRLGELPRADADRIEARLPHDAALRQRLTALDVSDNDFERASLGDALSRGVRDRIGQAGATPAAPGRSVMRWAVPAAVAAAVVLLVFRAGGPGGFNGGASGVRIKGPAATLMIYRSTSSGSEMLADNDLVHAGDVIRIGYRAAGTGYGTIVSVDGRGVVTFHLPPDGARAVALEAGHNVLLDRAFELDDAPTMERFYFVTGASPFDVGPVLDAVRRDAADPRGGSASLTLPRDLDHTVFSLRKDTRP